MDIWMNASSNVAPSRGASARKGTNQAIATSDVPWGNPKSIKSRSVKWFSMVFRIFEPKLKKIKARQVVLPIGSMYGIYANIGGI